MSRSTPPTDPACERPDLAAKLPIWDQLPAPERRAVETHASGCASCGSIAAATLTSA